MRWVKAGGRTGFSKQNIKQGFAMAVMSVPAMVAISAQVHWMDAACAAIAILAHRKKLDIATEKTG